MSISETQKRVSFIIFKVEAERQASKEEENKASEEYIQRLLAEEEEEEKRQREKRRSEMEEQLRGDEELARSLSTSIVSLHRHAPIFGT
jgi:hypothetical protein